MERQARRRRAGLQPAQERAQPERAQLEPAQARAGPPVRAPARQPPAGGSRCGSGAPTPGRRPPTATACRRPATRPMPAPRHLVSSPGRLISQVQAPALAHEAPPRQAALASQARFQAPWPPAGLSSRVDQPPAGPSPGESSSRAALWEALPSRAGRSSPEPASSPTWPVPLAGWGAGLPRRRTRQVARRAWCARLAAQAARCRFESGARHPVAPSAAMSAAPTSPVEPAVSARARRTLQPGPGRSEPRRGRASA